MCGQRNPSTQTRIHQLRAGFSLIELLIALVVLSIVASFAIPAWFSRSEVTLDNAALLLASDLRDVQNRAAYQGRRLRVEFFEKGNGYRAIDENGELMSALLGPGPFVRDYQHDAVFEDVTVLRTALGGDRIQAFDDRGRAEEAGSITLGHRGEVRVLHIAKQSGLIEITGLQDDWVDSGR